ncbi:unnamed protein product [Cutaneotrichosporon oleaginosum]
MPRYRNTGRRRFKIPVPVPRRILGGIGRTIGMAFVGLILGPILVNKPARGRPAAYRAHSPHPSFSSDDD